MWLIWQWAGFMWISDKLRWTHFFAESTPCDIVDISYRYMRILCTILLAQPAETSSACRFLSWYHIFHHVHIVKCTITEETYTFWCLSTNICIGEFFPWLFTYLSRLTTMYARLSGRQYHRSLALTTGQCPELLCRHCVTETSCTRVSNANAIITLYCSPWLQ